MKAVTRVAHAAAEKLHQILRARGPRDLVPDRNLEVVLEVVRDPDRDRDRDPDHSQGRDPDQSPEVRLGRRADRDQDQAQQRVGLAQDQVPGQGLVQEPVGNRGHDLAAVHEKVDRRHDQGQGLDAACQDQDHLVDPGKRCRDQEVDLRMNAGQEARVVQNQNPYRDPDHDPDRVQGQRAALEAAVPVDRHGKIFDNIDLFS